MSTFVKADVYIREIPDNDTYFKHERCHCGQRVAAIVEAYIYGLYLPRVFICKDHLGILKSHD